MGPLLDVKNLSFGYGARDLLRALEFQVASGELIGVIGRNGAGKTTLLHLLLGLLDPRQGEVTLAGTPLEQQPRRVIAQQVALVPQEVSLAVSFSVRDVVAMGRNPHRDRFEPESPEDREKIDYAMRATEIDDLATRSVDTLSGGERQRVLIARAIAQETPLLLLDEPTANLDVAHQLEILQILRERCSQGTAALAAIHDLSLAARYCTRLLLLADGGICADGTPAEVLTEENLREHFGIEARIALDDACGAIRVTAIAPISQP